MIIGRILLISSTIAEKHKLNKKNKKRGEHRTVMAKYAGRFLMEFELWC
jgi:hypothetical protein